MRFLLIPENNSLSHIAKCLSIGDGLSSRGHDVHIAASKQRSAFLNQLGIEHHVLSGIQETDNSGFPTFKWFNRPGRIVDCIKEEAALIKRIKPHRVLGVFRFTLKASARIADVPYDSLICGCMLPESEEVLGFTGGESDIDAQRKSINTFFQYAGGRASQAFLELGVGGISDIRHALKGDRTFLWDFPEFMPLPEHPNNIHVGPIALDHWPIDSVDMNRVVNRQNPLAVVAFGTCMANVETMKRIARILLDLGYNVLVAAGGQKEMLNILPNEPRMMACSFAPLNQIFPYTSLLVTHGGQMTIFEALQNKVPVLVMPFQPEQAHNGVCLERIGCGCRLIPSRSFNGDSEVYVDALNRMADDDIASKITGLRSRNDIRDNLGRIKNVFSRYEGADALVRLLEEG